MPKNKTHSGAKKRFRVTGSGKIMREKVGHRHLLEHKSSKQKRAMQSDQVVHRDNVKQVRTLLGK